MAAAVECHSDIQYPDRPVAVIWQGERLEIVEILTRWRTPAGTGFRVVVRSSERFELFYDETCDNWQIKQI